MVSSPGSAAKGGVMGQAAVVMAFPTIGWAVVPGVGVATLGTLGMGG